MTVEEFRQQFEFRPDNHLLIGVRREFFTTDNRYKDRICALAAKTLVNLPKSGRFGHGLSACKIEENIDPCSLEQLLAGLEEGEQALETALTKAGSRRLFIGAAPGEMPLTVYPDPTRELQRIANDTPAKILTATFRMAGVNIQIGMGSHEQALATYNRAATDVDKLCRLGNLCSGHRLRLYELVNPDHLPRPYETWDDFFQQATASGFADDPQKCGHLIQLTTAGTIEFRTFDTTGWNRRICEWAKACYDLCV